ncbi:calcium-binding protein [Chachezhania antarctica]|uniref:calcium-binding protein n=1 Tax=Chachezhania antarctica TaxID=2340860 RepID=UPI000EB2E9B9|nr:calcium-binding protein [Chachezhania antarctica]|tara:strand:+ start:1228 stop:2577 length:1350 start_codon:yes stop_codon:yes gene_type:complete
MTTFNVTGFAVAFDENDIGHPTPTVASVIVPSKKAGFSYSVIGRDDGVPIVAIKDNAYQVMINGQTMYDNELRYEITDFIAKVTWSGGVSTVLGMTLENAVASYDVIFQLGGAALPAMNSSADWEKFDDSITGVSVASGKFAPGKNIKWSAFDNVSMTQEDDFYGTPDNDRFFGKQADDYFRSSAGNDLYNGGKGFDQVTWGNDPSGVFASLAKGYAIDGYGDRDTMKSIEMLRGSMFDDTLIGDNGRNHLRGLEGEDVLNGLGGQDVVRYDRDARYGGEDGVTVNLKKGFAIDGFGDRDTLKKIEDARGTESQDLIIGDKGKNVLEGYGGKDALRGLGGKDTLIGGAGRDKLDGGNGNDKLIGDKGADMFIFKGKKFGDDTVTDFQTGGKKEKINLDKIGSIKNFKDLKNNHLSDDDNGDALIEDGNGNSITLLDVAMSDLSANDFIF